MSWNLHHINAIQETIDDLTEGDLKAGMNPNEMNRAIFHLRQAIICLYKAEISSESETKLKSNGICDDPTIPYELW
jgi:hypothetical protein